MQPRYQRMGLLLLRGPERDLDVVGHPGCWVGGVVPGRGRDARITQEIGVVRLGLVDVRAGDVYVRMKSPTTAAAAEVAAPRGLRVTGDRPVSEPVELDPAP